MLDSTLIWMMNRIKGCQGASTPPLASTSLELQLQLCKALPVSHAELHHSPACSKELLLISSDGFECGKPNDINLYTIRGWSSHGNIGFTTLSLSLHLSREILSRMGANSPMVPVFRLQELLHMWLQSPTCWCWAHTSKTRNVISHTLW